MFFPQQVHVHFGQSPVHPGWLQELQSPAGHPDGVLEGGANLQRRNHGSDPQPRLDPTHHRQTVGTTEGTASGVCQEESSLICFFEVFSDHIKDLES